MIISENNKPTIEDFRNLMQNTDKFLNDEASKNQDYFSQRTGTQLETDVFEALQKCAINTPFENTISLISGPAIIPITLSSLSPCSHATKSDKPPSNTFTPPLRRRKRNGRESGTS